MKENVCKVCQLVNNVTNWLYRYAIEVSFMFYINIKSSTLQKNNNLIINISFSIVIAIDKCTRDNNI